MRLPFPNSLGVPDCRIEAMRYQRSLIVGRDVIEFETYDIAIDVIGVTGNKSQRTSRTPDYS